MSLDAPTMLALTIALAAAASFYLAIEWRAARETPLLYWSAGFAMVATGSTLAFVRMWGMVVVGVWFANALLLVSHWLFLKGVAHFTERRVSPRWYLVFALWLTLLLLPQGPWWSNIMVSTNSLLVAALSLRAGMLLRRRVAGEQQLHYVLIGHGAFYVAKAMQAAVSGALIDLSAFRGAIIQISLIEGVMAIMLIALSMTGTVRLRREQRIELLAASDPLTGLYNRRALEARAPRVLQGASADEPGGLLLIDIDNFKLVNDSHGHSAGDRLLVGLSELIRAQLPAHGIAARLGGDEFAIVLRVSSGTELARLGEALREQFRELAEQAFPTPEPVTLSMGATLFDQPPASLSALIERGDQALYEAKRGGRDALRGVHAAAQPTGSARAPG